MSDTSAQIVSHDMKTLVKDAQALFQAATSLTGEKAEEVRNRGMHMLDTAMAMAQEAQANALVAGKQMAASADHYVKENPWRIIAAAVGVGFVVGLLVGRK